MTEADPADTYEQRAERSNARTNRSWMALRSY